MTNNINDNPQQSITMRPPEKPKDKSIIKGNLFRQVGLVFLFTVGLFALAMVVIGIFSPPTSFFRAKNMEKTAIESLKLKTDNPESIKVLSVSKPDSVYRGKYCSEEEIAEISQKFIDRSLKLMESSSRLHDDADDPAFMAMIESYSKESHAIDRLNAQLTNEKGDFCGYNVRVRFKALDQNNNPYAAEGWFIFDRNKEHIIDYLELPLL